MARLQQLLPSSFHGTTLLFSRSQAHPLLNIPSCSSLQSHSKRGHGSPPYCGPISKRHISSSLLTSSLHMQTPQGEALLAMTNERLPPVRISQAASEQLELLAAAAESARSKDQDLEGVLQRRIAEIQEKEITKALQDITLALVTHRLLHALPDRTPRQLQDDVVDASRDRQLQAIHPPLLHPLIDKHVALVVNGKDRAHLPFQPHLVARVCTFQMGKLYAASIIHGYFLAHVYQRFKLERLLHLELEAVSTLSKQRDGFGLNGPQAEALVSMEAYLQSQAFIDKEAFRHLNIDVGSSHTLDVIERHCQALFGVMTTPALRTSSILTIQLGSVRSLILQALAFGALLWDVENNFISSFYPLDL